VYCGACQRQRSWQFTWFYRVSNNNMFTYSPKETYQQERYNIGLQHYSTALRTTLPCQERVSLFWTITPMFLGECLGLHFCTNEKRNECYTEELQNLQLFLICGFTLPHKKHMIKQHISKSTVTVFSYLTARSRMSL